MWASTRCGATNLKGFGERRAALNVTGRGAERLRVLPGVLHSETPSQEQIKLRHLLLRCWMRDDGELRMATTGQSTDKAEHKHQRRAHAVWSSRLDKARLSPPTC